MSIGTWTPVLSYATPGATPATFSYSGQFGNYARIGNMVLITFRVNAVVTLNDSTGNFQISLPFANATTDESSGCGLFYGQTDATTRSTITVFPFGSIMRIAYTTGGSPVSFSYYTNTQVGDAASINIYGNLMYHTA